MAAEILEQKTSLMDSALGPVAVTTTKYSKFDVDDFVSMCVTSKAEYLRLVNKAKQVNPLEVRNRPAVQLDGVNVGGYDGV